MLKKSNKVYAIISLCLAAIFCSVFTYVSSIGTNFHADAAVENIDYSQSITPIFPKEDRYVRIEEPSAICNGGGTMAVLDRDKIIAKGSFNGTVSALNENLKSDTVVDMGIFNAFVFVLYGSENTSYAFDIFDVKKGTAVIFATNPFLISSETAPLLPTTFSIDSVNGVLYAAYGDRTVWKYPLSVKNGELSVEIKSKINTCPTSTYDIKCIYGNNKLYFINYKIGATVTKRVSELNLETMQRKDTFADVTTFATDKTKIAITSENLMLTGESKILAIPLASPASPFELPMSGKGIATDGDNLLLSAVNGSSTISEYRISNGKSEKIGDYGYKGDAKTLLNSPSAVSAFGEYYYILDVGNTRVVRYRVTNGTTVVDIKTADLNGKMGELKSIAIDGNGALYCGDKNGKVYIMNGDFTENGVCNLDSGNSADKLVFDGENNLYVLSETSKRVFIKKSDASTFVELMSLPSAVTDIGVSHLGNILYIATPTKISSFDLLKDKEERLNFSVDITSYGITQTASLQVDKKGNIALCATVNGGAVKVFFIERKLTSYQLSRVITLFGEGGVVGFSAVSDFLVLSNGNMLTVNPNANLIGMVKNVMADGSPLLPFSMTIDSDFADPNESAYFDVIKTTVDCYALLKPTNYENVISLKVDSHFVTLSEVIIHEGNSYYYIKVGNYKCYLPIAYAEKAENTPPPYLKGVVRHRTVKIYSKPILNDTYLVYTIDKKDAMIDIDSSINCFTDEAKLGFLKVTYGTYSGYVARDRISKYDTTEYSTTMQNYMKVKTPAVGAKIPLYKNANVASDVLAMIGDGEKIVLLEPYDQTKGFLLVSYNGVEGYISPDVLYANGLSTSQIIAISLVGVVIAVGIILFFVARAVRKKNYEYAEGEDPTGGYYDDNELN